MLCILTVLLRNVFGSKNTQIDHHRWRRCFWSFYSMGVLPKPRIYLHIDYCCRSTDIPSSRWFQCKSQLSYSPHIALAMRKRPERISSQTRSSVLTHDADLIASRLMPPVSSALITLHHHTTVSQTSRRTAGAPTLRLMNITKPASLSQRGARSRPTFPSLSKMFVKSERIGLKSSIRH